MTVGQSLLPVQTNATAQDPTNDRSARLRELQKLHEQGLVSDEELAEKRQKILEEI